MNNLLKIKMRFAREPNGSGGVREISPAIAL